MGLKRELFLTVLDCVREYFRSTSTHGLRRIGWSKLIWVKCVWGLLFLVSVIGYSYIIVLLFKEYLTYPTKTVVSKAVGYQDFPGVTVCNLNPIRVTQVNRNKPAPTPLDPFYKFVQDAKFNISKEGDNDPYLRERGEFATNVARLGVWDARIPYGHQLRDMIVHCAFHGRECHLERDFLHVWSDVYGNCYTFSGGKASDTAAWEKKVAREPGPLHGLVLMANVESSEHLRSMTESKGIRLLIHPSTAMPFPEQGGVSVPAGMEALINLNVDRYTYLGHPYTPCHEEETNRYGYTYSSVACTKVCKQEQTLTYCKCADPTLPVAANQTVCSVNNIYSIQYRCHRKVMREFESGVRKCNCPVSCNELRYQSDFSLAKWPATTHVSFIDDILKPVSHQQNNKEHYEKGDLVSAKVFFKEIARTEYVEEATFTLADFFTHIGGLSCLFIGVSMLTGMELIELLITLCTIPCVDYPAWPIDVARYNAENEGDPQDNYNAGYNNDSRPPSRPGTTATTRDVDYRLNTPDKTVNKRPLPKNLHGGKLVQS